jgi:hypothetical protein
MSFPLATPPLRRRSWLLILSLGLNVILVVFIVAAALRGPLRPPPIGGGGMLAPRSIMAALPNAAGPVQQVIDAHTPKMRALRLAAANARREAFRELAAPDYTPQKLTAALETVRVADGALEAESITMMRDSLKTLSTADRQTLVERVRNRSWWFRLFRRHPR